MTPVTHRAVTQRAVALALDPHNPAPILPVAVHGAAVVGLGAAVRTTRELTSAAHALLAALVDGHGFRAVLMEGTDHGYDTAEDLDRWVRTGDGDPAALLRRSQGFLHNTGAVTLLHWLRGWALAHPDDPVRVVHHRGPGTTPTHLADIERDLADRDLRWHERTGQRIVHWGGLAHTVVGDPRTLGTDPEQTHRNAGGHLRAALGDRYAAIALTVGRGHIGPLTPDGLPAPDPRTTEAAFADVAGPVLLAPHPDDPADVAAWWRRPLRVRTIGPVYDRARDTDFHVGAGPVREAVAAIAHVPVVSPAAALSTT